MESTLSIEQHGVYPVAMEQETFGQMLQRGRALRGINQRDFAVLIGVEPGTMSRWENDKRTHPPSPEAFQKIRQELRLDERDMLRALGYLSDTEAHPKAIDANALKVEAIGLVMQLNEDQLVLSLDRLRKLTKTVQARQSDRRVRQPSTTQ